MMTNLLLLSGSSYQDSGYLVHTRELVGEFLKSFTYRKILFIPYAGVRLDYDAYEDKVKKGLEREDIVSLHRFTDPRLAIEEAEVILVGGGNSFMLLHLLQQRGLLECICKRVKQGIPYIGWSAGANLAGKTIKTTNDMPIIAPCNLDSLGLFPHQINPHFISGKIAGHNGESREERLQEYLITNPNDIVFALPEGSGLCVRGNVARVIGYQNVLKITAPLQIKELLIGQEFQI